MTEQLTTANAPDWSQWVTNFDTALNMYNQNYQGLLAQRPYIQSQHPELLSWYNDLVNKATNSANQLAALQDMRNTVNDALASIGQFVQGALQFTGANDALAWANGVAQQAGATGSDILSGFTNWLSQTFGEVERNRLGVLPLLPLGIVAATAIVATAAIVVANMYAGAQRLNALKQLEGQGYSAQSASQIVNQTYGGAGAGTFLGIDYKFILLAVLGIVALPKVLDLVKGSK